MLTHPIEATLNDLFTRVKQSKIQAKCGHGGVYVKKQRVAVRKLKRITGKENRRNRNAEAKLNEARVSSFRGTLSAR